MKKINVSQDRCIGCGACVAIDPEHFEFNDDGKSSVVTNENLESENLVNAIESCPTSAIEMVEAETTAETCDSCENCDCGDECDCENCECDNSECGDKCDCENENCNCNPCTCGHCECNDVENEEEN